MAALPVPARAGKSVMSPQAPPTSSPLAPMLRAVSQLDDPVLLGVVVRSAAWAAALFVALALAVRHEAHLLLGMKFWLADLLGGIGAAVLAYVLFLPVAGVLASLFAERVAAAVERRFYPGLPPARPAPLGAQIWDGLALGVRVLLLQIASVLLAPLLGISLPLGWAIAAWAIGRGLFVAVAMRRMRRDQALALYRSSRPAVLFQGVLIAAGSLIPLANLLVPVLGVAAMVHVLHARHGSVAGLSLATRPC
jgi:CysZ protein